MYLNQRKTKSNGLVCLKFFYYSNISETVNKLSLATIWTSMVEMDGTLKRLVGFEVFFSVSCKITENLLQF